MRSIVFIFTLLICLQSQISQAQETPKTLLWRISGNGFLKPCYLYGTMHTGDKRVYHIGDSVYSSISFCDGFAMEVDPGENVDTFINNMEAKQLDIAYREAIVKNQVKQDPYYYKRKQWEMDSAYQRYKQRYNDLSTRDLNRLRRVYRQRDKDEMNTTFDLYLFDLAKTQGKVVGGLEDISGRTKMLDELGNTFDPDLFLKTQRKKYVDVLEWMVTNYVAAELDKLHEFSKYGATEKYLTTMLFHRNHIMAKRIDSLGNLRSTFYAVGAAHLPGDSGIISLLRNKGFTVEPVFSSKKIEPGDYKFEKRMNTLISVSDMDSNYVVKMPGKPTDVMGITNKLFVRVYKELSNEIMLMCGTHEDGDITNTLDKEVSEMRTYFNWHDVKVLSSKKISRQNLDGHEFFIKGQKGYLKLHIFQKNGKTYLFAAGAKTKDSVEAARANSYLQTYTMNLDRPAGESGTISFISPGKAFSISMPAQPKIEHISGTLTETKQDITLFSSIDLKKKNSYLVMVKEPFKGYFTDFDSTIFTQTTNEVLKRLDIKNIAEENILLNDHPALKIKALAEADNKMTVVYSIQTLRHNRFYNITVRGLANTGYEEVFDKFINSFQFLPYTETKFETRSVGNNLFSVSAPSPVSVLKNKVAGAKNRTDYYAFDSCTAMSYGITALGLGKYYWAAGSNELLNEYARFQFNDSLAVNNILDSDSLLYKRNTQNGTYAGKEILIKTLANNTFSRIRIMQYADSVFILNAKGDQEMVTNSKADDFFNSFRFGNDNVATTAFASKTELFLKDLRSADSTQSKAAADELSKGLRFPPQDMQNVLEAFLSDYSRINSNGLNIPLLLSQAIGPHGGPALVDFAKTNYPLLQGKREELKMLIINMLSASNDPQSYPLLKAFLIADPPSINDYATSLSNFKRSPQMAATLFPEIAVKLKDDLMAPAMLELTNMLIDSNKLQYSSIAPYESSIISAGKRLLTKFRNNNSETYQVAHTDAILQMLVKMNQKQSRTVLNDLSDLQNYNLSKQIMIAYAGNNQQPPADQVNWYCSHPARRIELYDEFIKINKQALFAGEYATQRSFADAFMHIFTESEIDKNIETFFDLVAIKDAAVKHTSSRFYIYKVTCKFRRGTEVFTGIIGPFSVKPSEFSIKDGSEAYVLNRKTFDEKNIDTLFKDFIEQVKKMR